MKPKKKAPRKRPAPAKKPAARKRPTKKALPKKAVSKRAQATVAPVAPVAPKRKRRPATRTLDKRGAFLAAYRISASIKHAAKVAGIDRRTHYDWLRTDAAYHVRFREAQQEAAGAIEDEAIRRAMEGVYEPNVFQGRFVYPQEEYVAVEAHGREPEVRAWRNKPGARPLGLYRKSDTLMMFLLRGFLPEKYKRFTQIEMGGPGGGPIPLHSDSLQRLTDDELATLRELAEKLAADGGDSG